MRLWPFRRRPKSKAWALIALPAAAAVVIAAPLAREAVQEADLTVGPLATVDEGQGGTSPALAPSTTVDGGGSAGAAAPAAVPQPAASSVESPPPTIPANSIANGPLVVNVADTLACIRAHESDTAGGYRAISPDGTYRGAYQFDRPTWVGVGGTGDPAAASPAEQDQRAAELLARRGTQPWGGICQ